MTLSSQNDDVPVDPTDIRVLIFGPLRRLLGTEEFYVAFPAGGSQREFWTSILERFPEMRNSHSAIRLARDSEFIVPEDILNPGDEVALIPPVSGG